MTIQTSLRYSKRKLLFSLITALSSATLIAQSDDTIEEIIVVGSQIKGSTITDILPVSILDFDDIAVTGADSGLELLKAIPQIGNVTFNESAFTGINGARGDIGSVNLRGIGTGNTLVLLNGRRLVLHPGTQVENFVPVNTVNSNSLPVTGIERLEVLRDGASAIYGTDAVAGVINSITKDDFEGFDVSLRYGSGRGDGLDEFSGTLEYGVNFNDDRSNFSIFANFFDRSSLSALERPYSATEDLRTLFVGTLFEGDTDLRNLSTQTAFGEFRSLTGEIAAIGDDDFHVQPNTAMGCLVDLGNGLCADDGGLIDTSLRLDRARYRELVGNTSRQNIMAFFNHDLGNETTFFAEVTYYHADYDRQRETAQLLSSQRIVTVPSTAFYNPLGVDLQIRDYRALDTGPRNVSVENNSYRLLGGLRGNSNNWDWETAALYSQAKTDDITNRASLTLFQQAIARTTSDAYNIFAGGNPVDTNAPGTFNPTNSQATIDSFIVPVSRVGTTELGSIDFKISNPSIFSTQAGDAGLALGAEFRYESFEDDRDDRLDGSITFTDIITGTTVGSDVIGSSPSPDTKGDRRVWSGFAELAIPLVSDEMDIPFVHSLDMQLALRAESFSDAGSVAKPKIALAYKPIEDVQIRVAFSQGFRAPNLEQINADGIRRVNTGREDWILCEATARAAGTATFTVDDECDNVGVEVVRSGGPDLQPEENDNFSIGVVYQPRFLDDLTITIDWWKIEQEDVVGLFGDQNQISLDYLLRLQGSSNPNVIRETPDQDTIDLYTAAGLDPAGDIIEVADQFVNFQPREFQGLDLGVVFGFDIGSIGRFTAKANGAYLQEAFQTPSAGGDALLAAVESGTINSLVDVTGQEDLIEQNGRPEWRANASLRWENNNWGAGIFFKHVGSVIDTSVTGPEGLIFKVDSFNTFNLNASYNFDDLWGGGGCSNSYRC